MKYKRGRWRGRGRQIGGDQAAKGVRFLVFFFYYFAWKKLRWKMCSNNNNEKANKETHSDPAAEIFYIYTYIVFILEAPPLPRSIHSLTSSHCQWNLIIHTTNRQYAIVAIHLSIYIYLSIYLVSVCSNICLYLYRSALSAYPACDPFTRFCWKNIHNLG